MNRESILAFLKCLGAKRVTVHGKWVSCSCLLAPWTHDSGKDSNPSSAIQIKDGGESFFHCFTCDKGKLSDLLFKLQHFKADPQTYRIADAWELVSAEGAGSIAIKIKEWGQKDEEVEVEIPYPEQWLATFKPAWSVGFAREYLEARGVSEELCKFYDIRCDFSMQTVCFPIRNFKGELVSLRGRFTHPDASPPYHVYKYLDVYNRLPWLGESWVDFNKPVVMVESVFDAISVSRVYKNVVAPLSVGISKEKALRMQAASYIVTLFDQGTGGDKARKIIGKHFKSALLIQQMPPEHRKDPGEMTETELRESLKSIL